MKTIREEKYATLRDEIEYILSQGLTTYTAGSDKIMFSLDTTTDLILNIVVERLPKPKEITEREYRYLAETSELMFKRGFNQALKDVREMLGNLEGLSDEK